ncbi:MAG: adenylate/guanylate cyclase domain-containing protein [Chloroflexota bacterium]|nr:adenylate/guanylate cyclase domain-containing protein [Chloroflexota bacterium]
MTEQQGTILVVDDTPAILLLLQKMLSGQGYEVCVADSGARALESVKASPPDLILLDIMMPEMSGFEVCECLKADAQTCDIPIIFISALSETKNIVDAFALGGVDYVTKPFQQQEILARVATHLILRSAQKKLKEKNAQLEQVNDDLTREVAERKRTEEALHRHAARLKIQRELHQSILAARSPETVAMAAIGRVRQLIPCHRAVVVAIGENGAIQTLAAESSGEIKPISVNVYRELFEDSSLSDGRVRGSDDLTSLPRRSSMQQALYTAGVRSYILVPLLVQGEPVGALHLETDHPSAFTHNHITIAAEVATSLELAIRQARLYEQAQRERQRADKLLLNILPASVADDLKETGKTTPQKFENVTVCFSDIVGFTSISSQYEPEFVIGELNDMFTAFDNIMESNQCERIKTAGDAYLAVCGMPEENENHAGNIVWSAIEMIEYLKARSERSEVRWQMRIGVHSGPVVGGVVGTKKYIYDVFGDTINTASRMESYSEPMRVNVSGATYCLVKDEFRLIERATIEVKGKGEMRMYFVDG